jgi:predicted adenine nucleotide alpha hydrolase (AANH) superfamily ATPase
VLLVSWLREDLRGWLQRISSSVIETETETGVLCLICIIHKMTPVIETALESGESVAKISLQGLATQVLNPDSQQKSETK